MVVALMYIARDRQDIFKCGCTTERDSFYRRTSKNLLRDDVRDFSDLPSIQRFVVSSQRKLASFVATSKSTRNLIDIGCDAGKSMYQFNSSGQAMR